MNDNYKKKKFYFKKLVPLYGKEKFRTVKKLENELF